MKNILTSSIALVMAIVLCLGGFPAYKANASDADIQSQTDTIADVEAELTLDKTEVILGDEDIIEDDWVYEEYYRLYQETVNITLTVQGEVESIYRYALVEFDYQTVYMSYDSASSTEATTVYKGFICVNQYTPGDKDYVLDEIYLVRSDNGEEEKVQCEPATLKVTRDFADKELPQLESVSIDYQGETINTGQIVISIKASDNVGIDEDNSAVEVKLATTLEELKDWKSHSYEWQTQEDDGTYKVVINLPYEGIPQSKWYIAEINLYDTVRNKNIIEFGPECPYYFYINQTGESGSTPEEPDVTPEQPDVTPEQPDVTPEEPDNTPENPDNGPEETIEEITPVKDKKTEEAVQQETQQVVADIVSGSVSDTVVDEKTAEKVTEAINKGQTVTAKLVVKEVERNEIAQNEKNAIEEKVSDELGEDAKIHYMNVSIVLVAGDKELGTLNKLQEEITITIAIPKELKEEGRTYKVIRSHGGEITVLDTVVNEDGTISFKTDRFSTYALAYADKEETSVNPNTPSTDDNKVTNTDTKPNVTPSTNSKVPQTGDNNLVMIYVAICLVALAAIIVTKKRNAFVK